MTSKVLVKMPEVPFAQVKKSASELVTPVSSNSELARSVNQLQENIRFLQTKHQQMLSSLHDEVDVLRQKNRDLQLQLILNKSNSPTNAEDTTEAKSTRNVNEAISKELEAENEMYKQRCLQLEKELSTTKTALQTSLARTAALQALLQQHKIQEVPWMSQQCGRVANMTEAPRSQDGAPDTEEAGRLQSRLEEAERLVRRLRAETDEQRRELQSIKASLSAAGRGNGGGRGNGVYRTGMIHQRFPPLQNQQAFWQQQQGPSQPRDNDYQVWNRGNRRSSDKDLGQQGNSSNSALPDLRAGGSQPMYNNGNNNGQNQSRRGGHGYNNHYYRNSERGHRYKDDEHQHKNYNTPELSEGEVDGAENARNNSYKHKKGHNKHQDKS